MEYGTYSFATLRMYQSMKKENQAHRGRTANHVVPPDH